MKMSHTTIDLVAGISGGVISNLVSHPLDTIKIRL